MRVLLLRHGKSDWNAEFDADHERPLNRRGERAARLMGQFIAGVGDLPDLVLTSTAVRARTTVEHAIDAGGWDCEVRRLDALYDSTPTRVLEVLREHAQGVRSVLVAGHEPTTSGTIRLLTGARVEVPTASCACIEVDPPFAETTGVLRWFTTPKVIASATDR